MMTKTLIRVSNGGSLLRECVTLPGLGHYLHVPDEHGVPCLAKIREIVWTTSAPDERHIGGSEDVDQEWDVVLFCDLVTDVDTSDGRFDLPPKPSMWDLLDEEDPKEPEAPVPISIHEKDLDDLVRHAVGLTKTLSKVAFANTTHQQALWAARNVAESSIATLRILCPDRVEVERVESYRELIGDLWHTCYISDRAVKPIEIAHDGDGAGADNEAPS